MAGCAAAVGRDGRDPQCPQPRRGRDHHKGAGPLFAKLADPEQVRRFRVMPMRFYAAYKAVSNVRWHAPLEAALQHSLSNVPALGGNTLILVDRSGSMFGRVSDRSELTWADSAALFGSALALRAEKATLVEFGTSSNEITVPRAGRCCR